MDSSAHGVATGTTEYATKDGSLLRHQISGIRSQRALLCLSAHVQTRAYGSLVVCLSFCLSVTSISVPW